MSILRRTVLAVAGNDTVSDFFQSSSMARSLVSRFVAGETLETAIDAARKLGNGGISVTLDLLGENVDSAKKASESASGFCDTLRAMRENGLDPNISIKL